MMNEDLKKSLIVTVPLLVLGLGLIAPAVANLPLVTNIYLGICATVTLILAGYVIALFSLRIPINARIGMAMLSAGGILTMVKIAADRLLAPGLPLGTLVPLAIIASVLAADGEAYAVKKKFLSVTFDGFGIGVGFTVLLVVVSIIRDVAGKNLFAGKTIMHLEPIAFFATTPGVLVVTAAAALCIGLVTAKRKKRETQE
jgi:electron transport complex protein RnfE